MYNQLLDTFLAVVDCKSLSKAAAKLFITPAAVMKQMNALESHLGMKLIKRSNQGIVLTAAGESIYKDSKKIMRESQRAIERAKAAQDKAAKIIRIGSSMLHPCHQFLTLWNEKAANPEEFKIKIVSYTDDQILSVTSSLGKDIDFLVGTIESSLLQNAPCFYELWKCNLCVAIPKTNALVKKESLEFRDLYGQHIMTVKTGSSPLLDDMREMLKLTHPQIIMEDSSYFYDMDTFNYCEENGVLLLTQDRWHNIHPSLKTVPVQWNFSLPYGLLYAEDISPEAQRFLKQVQELKFEDSSQPA
ncbi:MAG: LysR family transcriptional regulator [Oscillibacter sp.]|nr:LysR family transcriptional regulator [Oscillibacter sp.]